MRVAPLLLLLLLAGCTAWPPPGTGGLAELQLPAAPADPAQAPLHARLVCDLGRLAALAEASERTGRLTGRVRRADLIATRARREYAAGLSGDAARTLDTLEAELAGLRLELPIPLATGRPECP